MPQAELVATRGSLRMAEGERRQAQRQLVASSQLNRLEVGPSLPTGTSADDGMSFVWYD